MLWSTLKRLWKRISEALADFFDRRDTRSLSVQLLVIGLTVGLGALGVHTLLAFLADHDATIAEIEALEASENDLPTPVPPIAQLLGAAFSLLGALRALTLGRIRDEEKRNRATMITLWLAATGAIIAWIPSDLAYWLQEMRLDTSGENYSYQAFAIKEILIFLFVISFPIGAHLHFSSSLMDQYVLRSFLTPFSLCLTALVAIWILADLLNNGSDLARGTSGPGLVLEFYIIQMPQVFLFVMPITLSLSLLFSLSKMSRSNELISMLGSGRSLLRVLMPLFIAGIYASLLCLVFKFEWAPESIGYKENLLQEIRNDAKGKKDTGRYQSFGWLHVNEVDQRIWYVGRVPSSFRDKFISLVVAEITPEGQVKRTWWARSANWTTDGAWWLRDGRVHTYPEDGAPVIETFRKCRIRGWQETPWKITSSALKPEFLSVPDLSGFLRTNADYKPEQLAPYRTNWWNAFAEPFSCLVITLITAPLGVVYSRRGIMGGVAYTIAILAGIYVLPGVFLLLGKKSVIPAILAAWSTNLIFAIIAALLLISKSKNRDIPKLSSWLRNRKLRRRLHA
ncbi:MAG: LptF/LptG family permease [Verrucomicrobiales bacterium]